MWSAPSFAGRGNFEDLSGDGRAGYPEVKLTGGEPLVRPRMPQLVEKLKNMPGIEKVTLTTNGVLLKDQMSDFAGGAGRIEYQPGYAGSRKVCGHHRSGSSAGGPAGH